MRTYLKLPPQPSNASGCAAEGLPEKAAANIAQILLIEPERCETKLGVVAAAENIFGMRRQALRDAALDLLMPKCEEIQSAAVVGALQISLLPPEIFFSRLLALAPL
jgi:hypothetical protein